jgi:4-diphosphocytidyl-2-C-methyl-D-erythritol kinase
MSVVVRARGKINFTLDVLGKRPDGFHEVSMVMQSISLHDILSFQPSDNLELIWDPRGSRPPMLALDESNDILRAARLLKEISGSRRGAAIWLDKQLPIASGLGGGSADGAATLVGLNKMWQLNYSNEKLMEIAAQLGSDMPFCIDGGTAVASGRGEIVQQLPFVGLWHLAMFKPPQGISTKLVYTSLQTNKVPSPVTELLVRSIKAGDHNKIPELMSNNLESVTFSMMPELQQLKENLIFAGAEKAMMSGSGPTVFAITRDAEIAQQLVTEHTPPGWWSSICFTTPVGCEFVEEEIVEE